MLETISKQGGAQLGGSCSVYVSNLFASESCRGRNAQMWSEYAQPFAQRRPEKEQGGLPRDVQMCIH